MIHTDGCATIASYGDCATCHSKSDSKRVQRALRLLDTGQLSERDAIDTLAYIVRYRVKVSEKHTLLITAFTDQGYITTDGKVRRYL